MFKYIMSSNINPQPTQESLLTRDHRFLLNTYLSMYNSTIRQIDQLYANLDEIRDSIDILVSASLRSSSSTNRRRNRERNNSTETSSHSIHQTRPLRSTRDPIPLRPGTPSPLSREEIFEFTFVPADSQRLTTELQSLMRNFYNPIPVAPTLQQINEATSNAIFSEINDPVNSSCPITLERFTEDQLVCQIKHCGHIFNREQLFSWFTSNVRCPVCRYDIREYGGSNMTNEEPTIPATTTQTMMTDTSDNIISNITNILMADLLTNTTTDLSNNPFALLNSLLNFPNTTSSYSYTRR
jgi:hypothetical protein